MSVQKKTLCLLPLCVFAAAANLGLNYLVQVQFGFSLFLDTAFTIVMTFYAGLVPGLLTGLFSNIFMSVFYATSWGGFLFALCNMASAALTEAFIRKFTPVFSGGTGGEETGPGHSVLDLAVVLLLLSLCMCILISVMGGLIAFLAEFLPKSYVYYRTPELYFKLGLLQNGMPLLASEILARIPVNIVDRPVSVFGAYGIAFLLRRLVPAFSTPRPLR